MEPPVQQNPFAPELFDAEQLNAALGPNGPAEFPNAPRRPGGYINYSPFSHEISFAAKALILR